jgi:hypothetical protein
MHHEKKRDLYRAVKLRGKIGFAIENEHPVIIRDYADGRFSTTRIHGFEKIPDCKLLEFERFGKLAVCKVKQSGKVKGAIVTFNQQDEIQRCELFECEKGAFSGFYHNNRLAVIRNINPLSILMVEADGSVKNSLGAEMPYNIDEKFEMTSSIVTYRTGFMFAVRWQRENSVMHRMFTLDRNLRSLRISLPFHFGTPSDRISSFHFTEDDKIQLYVDSDGEEAMTTSIPADFMEQIYSGIKK